MNADTGELRRIAIVGDGGAGRETLKSLIEQGFSPVPEVLEPEACKLLEDKESIIVDIQKKPITPLLAWAQGVKQGRNEKCVCGSGKKYKNCCGA